MKSGEVEIGQPRGPISNGGVAGSGAELARAPGLQFWPCHIAALKPWVSCLTSLSHSFLISKTCL